MANSRTEAALELTRGEKREENEGIDTFDTLLDDNQRVKDMKQDELRQLENDCRDLREDLRDVGKLKVAQVSESFQRWDLEVKDLAALKAIVAKLSQGM
jgi:uncharacterized protein YcbK (DUF882 family)